MCIENYQLINSIGQILDIIGVILIFFFGIPPRIDPKGNINIVTGGIDENEVKTARKFNIFSKLGLILIGLGFILQLISNYLR